MEREAVVRRLIRHAADLRRHGVGAMYLFGSTARGEARADSDVDLFFDYADPEFSLVELVRVKRLVGEILGTNVHVMTRDSLHPSLKDRIEASAVRVL